MASQLEFPIRKAKTFAGTASEKRGLKVKKYKGKEVQQEWSGYALSQAPPQLATQTIAPTPYHGQPHQQLHSSQQYQQQAFLQGAQLPQQLPQHTHAQQGQQQQVQQQQIRYSHNVSYEGHAGQPMPTTGNMNPGHYTNQVPLVPQTRTRDMGSTSNFQTPRYATLPTPHRHTNYASSPTNAEGAYTYANPVDEPGSYTNIPPQNTFYTFHESATSLHTWYFPDTGRCLYCTQSVDIRFPACAHGFCQRCDRQVPDHEIGNRCSYCEHREDPNFYPNPLICFKCKRQPTRIKYPKCAHGHCTACDDMLPDHATGDKCTYCNR